MSAEPYYSDESVTLWHGDCLDVMRGMPDASVDSVVTDPPYGLEFMGREWDGADGFRRSLNPADAGRDNAFGQASRKSPEYRAGHLFQQWCQVWTAECLRVLKPGGHLLAFGGTRTWHRLAVAVEDAGFEMRDSIAWLYGSGFPKSLDVSKAIDKAAGATREVIGLGPDHAKRTTALSGTIAREGGDAPLGQILTAAPTPAAQQWQGWGTALKPAFEPIVVARKPLAGTVAGNVLAHGTGALNVDACRVDLNGESWSGNRENAHTNYSGKVFNRFAEQYTKPSNPAGRWPANVVLDASQAAELDRQSGTLTSGAMRAGTRPKGERTTYGQDAAAGYETQRDTYAASGGASRFFPVFRYGAKAPTVERPRDGHTAHPTVKPLDLMRWLVRLVTPPGGTVLEPFAGSGTTAEACVIEGFRCIAIEREAAYLPLVVARLSKPIQPDLFGGGA